MSAGYSATVVSHATEQSSRLLDDLQEEASRLSGICDELESTTGRRDQELASLSSMLKGIKRVLAPGSSSEGSRDKASPSPHCSGQGGPPGELTPQQQLRAAVLSDTLVSWLPDDGSALDRHTSELDSSVSCDSTSTAADAQSPALPPQHRRRRHRRQQQAQQQHHRSQEGLASPDALSPFSFNRLGADTNGACITPIKIACPLRSSAPAAPSSCVSNGSSRSSGRGSRATSSSTAAGSLADLLAEVSGTLGCSSDGEEAALLQALQGAQQQRAIATSMLTHGHAPSDRAQWSGRRSGRGSSNMCHSSAAGGVVAELLSWAEASSAGSGADVDEVVQLQRVETPWGSCLSTPRSGSGHGSELAPSTPPAAASGAAEGAMQLALAAAGTSSSGTSGEPSAAPGLGPALGALLGVDGGGLDVRGAAVSTLGSLQVPMTNALSVSAQTVAALHNEWEATSAKVAAASQQLRTLTEELQSTRQRADDERVQLQELSSSREAASVELQGLQKQIQAAKARLLQLHGAPDKPSISGGLAVHNSGRGLRRSHSCGQLGTSAEVPAALLKALMLGSVQDAGRPTAAEACNLCPALQARLLELEQRADALREAKGQVQLQLERERGERFAREGDAAVARQALRRQRTDAPAPLSMAGWEDLIEDASVDLQRIEGHVCASVQRLLDLQADCGKAASAAAEAERVRMAAEAAARAAELRGQEMQQQAQALSLAISSSRQARRTADSQLHEAQQQLARSCQAAEANAAAAAVAAARLSELQADVAAAQQELLGVSHSKEQAGEELRDVRHRLQLAREELQGAQHRLSQLQGTILERRRQLDALDGVKDSAHAEAEALSAQLKQARLQRSEALSEAEEARAELQRVLGELQGLHQECQASDIKLADTEENLASLAAEQQHRSAALEALTAQKSAAEAAAAAAQAKLKELEQQVQAKAQEFVQQSRAAGQADLQLRRAQQHLANLQAGTPALSPHGTANAAGPAAAAAAAAEMVTQQVALAAAESRRQLAEDRASEAERRATQLSSQLEAAVKQRDAAEQLSAQLGAKAEQLKERLRHRDQQLVAAQEQAAADASAAQQAAQRAAQQAGQQARELQHLMQASASERQAAQGLRSQLLAAQEELSATQQQAQQQHAQLQRERTRLQQQLEQAHSDLDAGNAELQSVLQQRWQLQQKVEVGQQQVMQLRQELAEIQSSCQPQPATSSAAAAGAATQQGARLDAAESELLRLQLELQTSQAAVARFEMKLQHSQQKVATLEQLLQDQETQTSKQQSQLARLRAALSTAQQALQQPGSTKRSHWTLQPAEQQDASSQTSNSSDAVKGQQGLAGSEANLQQALVEAQVEAELLRHQLHTLQQQQQQQHAERASQKLMRQASQGAALAPPLAAAMELLEQQLQAMCGGHASGNDGDTLQEGAAYPAQHQRMQSLLTRLQLQLHTQQQQLHAANVQRQQMSAQLQQKDESHQTLEAKVLLLQQAAEAAQQRQAVPGATCKHQGSEMVPDQLSDQQGQVHSHEPRESQDDATWLHAEVTRLLSLLEQPPATNRTAAHQKQQQHSPSQALPQPQQQQQQQQQHLAIAAPSTAPPTPQHPQTGLVPSSAPSLLDTPIQRTSVLPLSQPLHAPQQHQHHQQQQQQPNQLMLQLRQGLLRLSQEVNMRLSSQMVALQPGTPTATAADSSVSRSQMTASTSASTRPSTPRHRSTVAAEAQSQDQGWPMVQTQNPYEQQQQQYAEAQSRLAALQDACLAEQKLCTELQRARQQEEQQAQQQRQRNQELQQQAQALQADLEQRQQAVKALQQQARALERQLEQQSVTGAELRRQGRAAQEAAEVALREVRQKLHAAEEQWQQDRDSMSAQLRLLQGTKAAAAVELAALQQSCKEAMASATSATRAAAEATAAAKAATAEASHAAATWQLPEPTQPQQQQHHQHGPATAAAEADVAGMTSLAAELSAEVRRVCAEQARHKVAAKELGRALRSGMRSVRVRALALRADLERSSGALPAASLPGVQSAGLQGGGGDSVGGQLLPEAGAVGSAVLQHWQEVEALLSTLKVDVEGISGSTANGTASSLQSSSAERLCTRLASGLQRLQQRLAAAGLDSAAAEQAAANSGAEMQRAGHGTAADKAASASRRRQQHAKTSSDGDSTIEVRPRQHQVRSRNAAGQTDVQAASEAPVCASATSNHPAVADKEIRSTGNSKSSSNSRRLQRNQLLMQVDSVRRALLANR